MTPLLLLDSRCLKSREYFTKPLPPPAPIHTEPCVQSSMVEITLHLKLKGLGSNSSLPFESCVPPLTSHCKPLGGAVSSSVKQGGEYST